MNGNDLPYFVAISLAKNGGQPRFGSCLSLCGILQPLLGALELVAQVVLLLQRVHTLLQVCL